MKTNTASVERRRADSAILVKGLLYGLCPFLFSGTQLFGVISPFGIAFLGAVPGKFLLTALIGSALGSLLCYPLPRAGCYIASALLFCAGRILLRQLWHRRLRPVSASILSFVSMALPTAFYAVTSGIRQADLLLLCTDVLLGASFSYFFCIDGDFFLRPKPLVSLNYTQLTSLGILGVALLSAMSSVQFFDLNLGMILGVVLIYAAMSAYGVVGASVSAILVAISLNLYSMKMLEISGILIITSFLAGIFSPLKKLGQIAIFLAVSTFCLFLTGAPSFLIYRSIDIFLATAVFVLIPAKYLSRVGAPNRSASDSVAAKLLPSGVADKLSFASETVLELKRELEAVSERFSEIDSNNISSIYEAAANSVCRGCSLALTCWEENYNDTIHAFNPVSDLLRTIGEVTPEQLPTYFRERCCKTEKLCKTVNEYYLGFVAKQNIKRQTAEARRIVFDQFHSISGLLVELSQEISDIAECDPALTAAIRQAYLRSESEPGGVHCFLDHLGRYTVEIYTSHLLRSSPQELCRMLSSVTERDFELPSITSAGENTRIAFFERARYGIDWAVEQSCVGGSSICGDSFETFCDIRGDAYFLLSDGMGHGKRAAIDSVMTCSILLKLIKAGFGIKSAFELLGSSLLVKSTDESLATVDLAKVDLYTGKLSLCKAGAALSLLCHDGEIKRFTASSLPIGILQNTPFDEQFCTLGEGDVLLMLSDGAIAFGEGFLCEMLRKYARKPAKEIAYAICSEVKSRLDDSHADDITVAAIKLVKGI